MRPNKESRIEFRLDQMGASEDTINKILSTERDKEIFFNVLFDEDGKINEKLLQLSEDYHKLRCKNP